MRSSIKKTIALALTLCAASAATLAPNAGKLPLSPTPITAEAADTYIKQFKSGSITYKVYKDYSGSRYAVITSADQNITNVNIGATVYDGRTSYPITKIESGAFRYTNVTSVTVNSSMMIEQEAFANTENLVTFTINEQAKNVNIMPDAFKNSGIQNFYGNCATIYLQGSVFNRCMKLSYVSFGSSVKTLSLGEYLFFLLYNLKTVKFEGSDTKVYLSRWTFSSCGITSINLPNTVTSIPEGCFQACQFTSLNLPDSVKEIGAEAFGSATLPERLYIGKNVWKINKTAFISTSGLQTFNVDYSNAYYKSVDGVLYNRQGTSLICYPSDKKDYSFTTYATDISDTAIFNNPNLRELRLMSFVPNNRNKGNFKGLDNLEYLTIPSSEYSKAPEVFLNEYKTLLTTTKVHNLNNTELVTTPYYNSAPQFSSRIRSHMEESFEEYADYYFMKDYVDKMADYVVRSNINSSMSDIEKIIRLRRWIIDTADYDFDDMDNKKNHVDASVFLHKGKNGLNYTVCDGYARCFNILLQKAGFESFYIFDARYGLEDDIKGHAWNLLKLNDKWYHADITWDDSDYHNGADPNQRYDNFLCSDDQFLNDGHNKYEWASGGFGGFNKHAGMAYMDNRNLGDLNGDGYFTSSDVNALSNYVNKSAADRIIAIGDLDFDGRITSNDVDLLRQYINSEYRNYPTVRIWRFSVYES
ncbi:MAG: leucine-rich repeat protein [Ruminococcus sp.]|nr:leucine-rich repeat protein [Ruminococcus sp.]